MSGHTLGAMRAAEIITNGTTRTMTNLGVKTLEGVADIIDRQTAASELLAALKGLVSSFGQTHPHWAQARTAIAKAEGREDG